MVQGYIANLNGPIWVSLDVLSSGVDARNYHIGFSATRRVSARARGFVCSL